jgi:glycosyltransferase involved in cell wall biosynthesis
MSVPKRIFVVYGISYKPLRMYFQTQKMIKGFIRLGHDVQSFNYHSALRQLSIFKGKTLSERFYKSRVDRLLVEQIRAYLPDIVYIIFTRGLNAESLRLIRNAVPGAVLVGNDEDPWPSLQRNRIEIARELDILTVTNDGKWLQEYRDAGVPLCKFMPNTCDPVLEYRYDVGEKWRTNILWTGKTKHSADSSETLREDLVGQLAKRDDTSLYGCFRKPRIAGIDYLHAISGAKIGVSVNAVNSVRFYHSDRLTQYLSCGTCVLAKYVPGTELLFKGGKHLIYFNEVGEFFELVDWYLKHDAERTKIANNGMELAHKEFNCQKIAQYVLELVRTGTYHAPWTDFYG